MDFARLAVTHCAPIAQCPDFMFRLDVDHVVTFKTERRTFRAVTENPQAQPIIFAS